MTTIFILLILTILIATPHKTSIADNKYDHYLLSCGPSTSLGTTFDGRDWSTDENTIFSSFSSFTTSSTVVPTSSNLSTPFTQSRIFKSKFTYTFPVSPGPKFLRLFFYTDHFNSNFSISAHANHHLLLRNFTFLNISTTPPFLIKEYYINIPTNETYLNLTFSPFAFLNGIEVVSVPRDLYISSKDISIINVDYPASLFDVTLFNALETAYRLNIGGPDIPVKTEGKVSDMYREWKNDDNYTVLNYGEAGFSEHSVKFTENMPNYTAPEMVYQTYKHLRLAENDLILQRNLTWRFKVDPGFYYLLRFHWCEVVDVMTKVNQRVFDVYINNLTAYSDADVIGWAGDQYVPVYKDFALFVPGSGGGGVDLWIALRPTSRTKSEYYDVLLNGLEIFKMNRVDGSLDASDHYAHYDIPSKLPRHSKHYRAIVGGVVGSALLASLLAGVIVYRHKTNAMKKSIESGRNYLMPETPRILDSVCVPFSLSKIKLVTNDFNKELIIGHGGFGNVYWARLDWEHGYLAEVAIKRLNSSSKQGADEFITEIKMLSNIHHPHLVSLIGYCDESGEMILVYEYMKHGSLRDYLCETDNKRLSWNTRLSICLGAAKGLHYLHAGVGRMIIHRDVKSSNILLGENWVPKVSDFGLSKLGPIGGELHVSTVVKGSFGYMDPEYYMLQHLTEKSDVYSFGVVLFEVLCGRVAVNPNLPSEQVNLALWARSYQQRGEIGVIVDPIIKGEITPACLRKFGELAERCVRGQRTERPSMADVVCSLELALDYQQDGTVLICEDEHPFSISQFSFVDESQFSA